MDIVIKNKKYGIIDYLKGIAIIMVVFHHSVCALQQEGPLVEFAALVLNRIHVCLFFAISGFLYASKERNYSREGVLNFLGNKALQLLVPYYFFTVLFSLMVKCLSIVIQTNTVMGLEAKSFLAILVDPLYYNDVYFSSLWYVYVLFFFFVVNWFVSQEKISHYFIGVLMLLHILVNSFFGNYMNEILMLFSANLIFFFVGRYVWNYQDRVNAIIHKWNIQVFSAIILLCIICRIYFIDIKLLVNNFYYRALVIQIENVLLTLSAFCIFTRLAEVLMSRHIKWVRILGEKSYSIYLLHNPWIVTTIALICSKISIEYHIGIVLILIVSIVGSVLLENLITMVSKPMATLILGRSKLSYKETKR